MIRLAWAISILALSVTIAQPRVTYRLESDAMFTNVAEKSLSPIQYFKHDWYETYRHELRVFVKGTHERRAGYRVEPRFWFTHQRDSAEQFDWVLDQAYAYLNPSPRVTFLTGKQRAHWGTGLTYTPTDNLQSAANPLDPTRYLEGVYLARMDATLPWFSFSLLYTPDRNYSTENTVAASDPTQMAGARLYKLVGTCDFYATALHNFDNETNIGGAFSWDSGPVVLYGEAAWLLRTTGNLRHYLELEEDRVWKPRAVLGASKLFGNSSVYGEVYYTGWGLNKDEYSEYLSRIRFDANQLGEAQPNPIAVVDYANLLLLSKPTQELHQVYIAASGTYDWRDLWTFGGNMIYEPVGQTLFGYPVVTYIGYQNVSIAAGVSFAAGSRSSERPLLPSYLAADLRFAIYF
ncbi:MAG: hypothetical protein KDB65_11940 [Calditrichaeota bacterium]|nr:hypothetical protein [Calditrichota bacterium]MCB9368976.1 hypothetical protein [Calditrichota bacterium]